MDKKQALYELKEIIYEYRNTPDEIMKLPVTHYDMKAILYLFYVLTGGEIQD